MGGGLESHCAGRVYGADGAVHCTIRTIPPIHKPGAENHMLQLTI